MQTSETELELARFRCIEEPSSSDRGNTGRQQLALEGFYLFFGLWMINLRSCSIINVPQCGPQFENSLGGVLISQ